MAVQCPHCSGQMKAGECRAAEVRAAAAQPWYPVTADEEAAARATAAHRRWGRWLLPVAAASLILGTGVVAWQLTRQGDSPALSASGGRRSSALERTAEEGAWRALAAAFLEAGQWQALLPLSADSERVRPRMEWFYARNPFPRPASQVKLIHTERQSGTGQLRVLIQVATKERASVWLMLMLEDGAWKVDWEAHAAFGPARWRAFLRESAGAEVELNLLAALKPAADRYIIKSGVSPETHEALVIWAANRDSLAGAVVSRKSPLRRQFAGIGFNEPVKVVARVKMEDPLADPPLVSIREVLQTGWNRQNRGK